MIQLPQDQSPPPYRPILFLILPKHPRLVIPLNILQVPRDEQCSSILIPFFLLEVDLARWPATPDGVLAHPDTKSPEGAHYVESEEPPSALSGIEAAAG